MRSGLAVFMAALLWPVTLQADDWPQWLGPQRDSVWRESGIDYDFAKRAPRLRWSAPIRGGYSGPAVAGGCVVVMDWQAKPQTAPPKNLNSGKIPSNHNFVRELHPGKERVLCLREQDGKILWEHAYDCNYTTTATYAIGPRCTPTIDGDRVYTLGSEGDLLCLDLNDGSVVWSCNFVRQYGLKIPTWGVATHPLIDGERLICTVGGRGATCVAFNKHTGEEIWRALDASEPGYSAPVIYDVSGKRQLIIWHSAAIVALDPTSGRTIWQVPFQSTFAMSIGVPRLEGRRLFAMCFNQLSVAIDVAADGSSAEIAWRGNTRKGISGVMDSPFLLDGHIYGCGHSGRYTCASLATGERLWTSYQPTTGRRPAAWGHAFTVRHNDHFLLANDLGELVVAKLTPQTYQEVSRVRLVEPTHNIRARTVVWSHPAFANKSIYWRNDKELRCYSLAK